MILFKIAFNNIILQQNWILFLKSLIQLRINIKGTNFFISLYSLEKFVAFSVLMFVNKNLVRIFINKMITFTHIYLILQKCYIFCFSLQETEIKNL